MSKKDYEAAATLLQERVRFWENDSYAAKELVETFVRFFAGDSGRFDADRFRRACVPGANVRARG